MRASVPVAFAALLVALAEGGAAFAGDPAAADAHFRKGKDLLSRGQTAAACEELAQAEAADPTVGTLGLLAGCHEQLGKTATAYEEYVATDKRARASRDARGEFARKQAERLEATIPRLSLDGVDPPPPGLVVSLDQKEIPADRLRADLPVDPGSHKLEARADGRAPFVTTFEAANGKKARVTIAFGAPTASEPAPSPPSTAPPPVTDAPSSRGWSRPLGFALLGVGGASLVASGIFGGLAISGKNDSEGCGTAACKTTNEHAFTYATVSTVTFIGGAVLAGGGVVLLLTAPKSKTASADVGVRVGATPTATGVRWTLDGRF